MEKPKKRRWGRAVLIVLVVLLSVPTLLRAFVVESFKTPAGSMIPTLLIGDHFFITKTGYTPRRGDVVVFTSPRDESIDFVKRIVAIGGDTIELRDGVIHLDKKPIKRRRLKAPCSFTDLDDSGGTTKRPCVAFEEELDAGRYQVIQDQEGMDRDFAPKKFRLTTYLSWETTATTLRNAQSRVTTREASRAPEGSVRTTPTIAALWARCR